MEPFESDGLFWLPNDASNQVAGRISFNPAQGTRLSLIGSFVSPSTFADIEDSPHETIIHGVAGKRYLTLTGCRRSSSRIESPGIRLDEHRADFMFAGHTLIGTDELSFERVSVGLSNLYDWAGMEIVSHQRSMKPGSREFASYSLTLTPMDPIEHAMNGYKISIGNTWKILGSRQNPGFQQDFAFNIDYDTPTAFQEITADVATLQDLLTATTNSVSTPTKIMLRATVGNEGEPRQVIVQVYAQQVAQVAAKTPRPGSALLTFNQIGGLPAVARWFEFSKNRRVILGQMLSAIYNSQLYTENKFFNAVSAAETLHRMEFPNEVIPAEDYKYFRRMLARQVSKRHRSWLSQQLAYSNEPRLRDRLTVLANFGNLSKVMGCGAEDWARAVTEARNRMVHHDKGKGPGASSHDLYWLAESLRIITLLCIARFCDFQSGYLEHVTKSQSVKFIAEKVQQITRSAKVN
ncbi:HEPN domain-containing protein [Streptomyces sp. NPDC013740]|uniref:ApeA N-terminal domain 1-containing protein n=1 Tax=Streptomyces sp. NPDC013740 TaxID=3364867 RepID=UPI003701126B